MSAFSDIGYREDGPEEVEHIPGSVTTDGYRALLERRPASVANVRASSAGDEALERIKAILHERQGRNRRAQSTTRAGLVTAEAYQAARSPFMRGRA